jgi:glycine cleavage system aminomethyltransferase T
VWTLDHRPDFTAAESALDGFVRFDKPTDFIGKSAALAERARGPTRRLVTLVVDAMRSMYIATNPSFTGEPALVSSPRALTAATSKRAWRWGRCRPRSLQGMRSSPSRC